MEQKRIFVAINIDDSTRKYIHNKISSFEENVDAKWTDFQNYHLTLLFLGLQHDQAIGELSILLRSALKDQEEFELSFDKLVWGPSEEKKKMLWLRGNKNKELSLVREKISKAIDAPSFGIGNFKPHITLAKFRKKQITEAEKEIPLSKINISANVPVKSIDVMESVFLNGKRSYQLIDKIDLV